MPLLNDDVKVQCFCGRRSPNVAAHIVHYGDCPVLRCKTCFAVLRNEHPASYWADTPDEHRCEFKKFNDMRMQLQNFIFNVRAMFDV